MYPRNIKTDGYTHLYYAFVYFDPDDYTIQLRYSNETDMIKEFANLKTDSLQTWVAIGGNAFSEEGAATFTAWSDMCSTTDGRAAFIKSLKTFLENYDFQGVDLDWEYPGTSDRGGKRADEANFVSLLKEMRESFGDNYGISLTLPPNYRDIRYFDVKGLEPYVDHMVSSPASMASSIG